MTWNQLLMEQGDWKVIPYILWQYYSKQEVTFQSPRILTIVSKASVSPEPNVNFDLIFRRFYCTWLGGIRPIVCSKEFSQQLHEGSSAVSFSIRFRSFRTRSNSVRRIEAERNDRRCPVWKTRALKKPALAIRISVSWRLGEVRVVASKTFAEERWAMN